MFGGAWGSRIAIGLVALCISTASEAHRVTYNKTVLDCVPEGCFVVRYVPVPRLKPTVPASDNHQSGSASTSTSQRNETEQEIIINTPQPVPRDSEPPSEYEDQYSADNLNIQRGIRFWTAWTALVSSAGVILIGFTLWQTVRAANFAADTLDEAKNATRAANKTIKVTRKIGIKQSQAYLSPQGGEFWPVPDERHENPVSFYLRIAIKNNGQSPAYNTQLIHCDVDFMKEGPTPGMYHSAISRTSIEPFTPDIGPGATEYALIHVADLVEREIEDILSGYFHVYMAGAIRWQNEFGKYQVANVGLTSNDFWFYEFMTKGFIDGAIRLEMFNCGTRPIKN